MRLPGLLFLLLMALPAPPVAGNGAGTRIKDLVMVAGARDNQLMGYGLVAGIAGDGDKNLAFTVQSIANVLQWFDVTVPAQTLQSKNVAAVIVTADLSAFAKPGSRLDVQVSSLGDAKTLQGGILLQTPLKGADNEVYAVAQGAISIGGFYAGSGGGGGASVQKNHPTTAQIIGGALVEKEIAAAIVTDQHLELLLREPDFTSAARVAAAINAQFTNSCQAVDATTVRVRVPDEFLDLPVNFISQLEAIEVTPDTPARIIINERTGTIVANARIRIATCAVSHGNLTISIASTLGVSQPSPFNNSGQTTVTPRTETTVTESKPSVVALPEMPTVEQIASSLNALGVTPRDIMAIFQAMKQAGALQAELLIR